MEVNCKWTFIFLSCLFPTRSCLHRGSFFLLLNFRCNYAIEENAPIEQRYPQNIFLLKIKPKRNTSHEYYCNGLTLVLCPKHFDFYLPSFPMVASGINNSFNGNITDIHRQIFSVTCSQWKFILSPIRSVNRKTFILKYIYNVRQRIKNNSLNSCVNITT